MRALPLLLLLAFACSATDPRRAESVLRLPNPAERLVERLPEGGTRCAVTQTASLTEDERRLAKLVLLDAFSLNLESVEAEAITLQGESAFRALLYTRDVPALRQELEEEYRAEWLRSASACRGRECSILRAYALDDRTVMLSSGTWHSQQTRTRNACSQLLREHPDSVQVALVPERSALLALQLGRVADIQHAAIRTLRSSEGLLRIARTTDEVSRYLSPNPPASGTRVFRRRDHEGNERRFTHQRFDWEDLDFELDDRRRMRAALASATRDEVPSDVTQLDFQNTERVLAVGRTLRARYEEIAAAPPSPARDRSLARAGATLERLFTTAHERLPDHHRYTRALLNVRLRVLQNPRGARELAEELILNAEDADSAAIWRRALREIHAVSQEFEALSAALIEANLASRRVAPNLARILVGLTSGEQSMPYDALEELVLRASSMLGRSARGMARLELPTMNLEALSVFLLLIEAPRAPEVMVLAASTESRSAESAPRVPCWQAEPERRCALMVPAVENAASQIGNLLLALGGEESTTIAFRLETLSPSRRQTSTTALEADYDPTGEYRITRGLSGYDAGALARLAIPFARAASGTLFPMDEFSLVGLTSSEQAAVLRGRSSPDLIQCERGEGEQISCRIAPDVTGAVQEWRERIEDLIR